jgi:SAM-dependent methyltransferase
MSTPDILDATCGGRSIWLDGNKENPNTIYADKRQREAGFLEQDGRTYSIDPDLKADFRNLPFVDEMFSLVVFDPPHKVLPNGDEQVTGIMNKAYGALYAETWQHDLQEAFTELFRVLEPSGTLIFKFADSNRRFDEIIQLAPTQPLFGTTTTQRKTSETRFYVFRKEESE